MKDHIWEHNNRYRLIKVDGQQDQYDLIPVPGTVYEVGTPINKATMLQDSTYTKYKNAAKSGALPSVDNGTPNDVFNALFNAYAYGTVVVLKNSQEVGYGQTELEGFAKFSDILYDATGKCTYDTDGKCTKIYIPKGIKKVLVESNIQAAEGGSGQASATIYKNGAAIQSISLYLPSDSKYYIRIDKSSITTTGTGSEYIQIMLKGAKGNWPGAISIKDLKVHMLS